MIADDPGGCDPGDKRKIGGHRGVRPFPDEEEKDDDYIEYDVHLRSHRIARCVSKMATSPLEEGCMQTSRTILLYDFMFHTPLLLRRVVHIYPCES